MPVIRIEAVEDEASGLFYVAIFNPAEATVPYMTTSPRYGSAALAENDVMAQLAVIANSGGAPRRNPH